MEPSPPFFLEFWSKYIQNARMEQVTRFLQPESQSFFLFGPRGTGKTLWTQVTYPEALIIDLLDPEYYRILQTKPEYLIELVEGNLNLKVVIIDEIQKIPELLDAVHLLIERYKYLIFILTGSSARKLRSKGVNLLGGRAFKLNMHPYMAAELGSQFNLEKALNYGMLPLIWGSAFPEKALKAYISIYLQEEVQIEGMVRNVGSFARFLEALSFSQGSLLNTTNIARESEAGRKTVEGYITILEDLLLSFHLNVFSKRAKRELTSHPKFYYFDCGVYRSARPQGPIDKASEIDGIALETLIAQHLRAWCDYSEGNHQLYYWQTRTKIEVDFIIYGKSGLYAIEVKNTKKINSTHLSGLKAFGIDYPEAKRFLLYRGRDRLMIENILCLPCEEFLMNLIPNQWPR